MSEAATERGIVSLIPELREMVKAGTLVLTTHQVAGFDEYHLPGKGPGGADARLYLYYGRGSERGIDLEEWRGQYFELVNGVTSQQQAAAWIKERTATHGK